MSDRSPAPTVAPHGSWTSPITADRIARTSMSLGQVVIDGPPGREDIYWSELRPAEKGRSVILRRSADGHIAEVTPPGFSARTRVHEYGGAAFTVSDGTVWFCNDADQRIYMQPPGSVPTVLTPPGTARYAEPIVDHGRQRLIAVREGPSRGEPVNELAAIDFDGTIVVLATGADFYASPRLSPDGQRLAWIAWDHPNMPWDGTELWVAEIADDGNLGGARRIAGGARESIFQPEWSPDGELFYVSDRTGWWNLYRHRAAGDAAVFSLDAEFGLPLWVFGMSTYGFRVRDRILCFFLLDGVAKLAEIDLATGDLRTLPTPYVDIQGLRAVPGGKAVFIGAGPRSPAALVMLDPDSDAPVLLRRSTAQPIDPGYVSMPQPIAYPTADGLTAHAFFYPPRNRDFVEPADAKPPLLVKSHGGPTSQATAAFSFKTQYWTSRGFAVLDVNYGGSTGFGRVYRERLDGQWGVVDVADCANGARWLVEKGLVDGDRLAITGNSAGGYTTLCALTFTDAFRAGASHYGIGDLEALVRDTHKFESRYLDRLVGPWPAAKALYAERSPIHHTDRLGCPAIFFQGSEDRVVPPNQAEAMVAALRGKGIPVAYVPFEGEAHGFRQADNIRRALEAELYFYGRVFGFDPADSIEPVEIENL